MKQIESPAELLELAVGFQKSQTVFTFVELEIPKILQNGILNASEVAKRLKIHPLAMERFLNACVVIGLLEKEKDYYSNTDFTEKFLIKKKEFYLGGQMRRYQKRSYRQWENLTGHLRNWKYGQTAKENPNDEDQGADAMIEQHNLALLHGFALADIFNFSNYKKLLDIGGGTGAMSIALCEKFPHLKATVLDLPENIKIAEKMIHQNHLQNRIKCISGDIINDELPKGFDVVLLANFLAGFDAETNQKLLKRIYEKLPKKGACLISGWILDENRLSPEIAVLFCLEDICWNAPDVERNFTIYREWLEKAGFQDISQKTYFEPTKLISGFKK